MEFLSVIILVIICIVLGFLAGTEVARWRAAQDASPKGEADKDRKLSPVARVWRDEAQNLAIEIKGKTIHAPVAMNAKQRALLEGLLQELASWLVRSAPRQAESPAQSEGKPEHMPGSLEAQPSEQAEQPAALKTSRFPVNPLSMLVQAINADVPRFNRETLSIAAQIDEILQEKLVGTLLAKRDIHLLELPNQGVAVKVGLEKYETIDAVPDEEIRLLIREAVVEWEQRALKDNQP